MSRVLSRVCWRIKGGEFYFYFGDYYFFANIIFEVLWEQDLQIFPYVSLHIPLPVPGSSSPFPFPCFHAVPVSLAPVLGSSTRRDIGKKERDYLRLVLGSGGVGLDDLRGGGFD